MRPELERYQQIDLYLQNKLSAEDKAAFETAMQNDPALMEEVEIQRIVNTVVLNAGYNDLKAKMSSDIDKIDNKARNGKWKKGTAIGIIGLLMVSAGVWLTQSEEQVKPIVNETKTETIVDSAETIVSEVKEKAVEIKKNKATIEAKIAETKTEKPTVISVEKEASAIVQKEKIKPDSSKNETEKPVLLKNKTIEKTPEKTEKQNPQPVKEIPEPVDICAGVSMEITPMVDASCKEMPTGIIDLQDGIAGGKLPYEIFWMGLEGSEEIQKGLSGGYHSITIKDANGCTTEHQVFVPTESCISTDAINPDNGEEWVFTNKKQLPFSIRIISLSGREILRKENVHEAFFIWQGKDRNGASLQAGTYAWMVEYSDGTRNTGQITIIR